VDRRARLRSLVDLRTRGQQQFGAGKIGVVVADALVDDLLLDFPVHRAQP